MITILASAGGTILGMGTITAWGLLLNHRSDREHAALMAASDARIAAIRASYRPAR